MSEHSRAARDQRHDLGSDRPRAYRLMRSAYRRVARSRRGAVLTLAPLAAARRRLTRSSMGAAEVLGLMEALRGAGVPAWLAGGWGVDALAGRQLRRHEDVDVLVDERDEARASGVLRQLGFRPVVREEAPPPWPGHQTLMIDPGGRRVDLHAVGLAATAPGDGGPGAPAWTFGVGVVRGQTVRCLSTELQLALHEGYAKRDRDRHDVALLTGRSRRR